MRPVGTIVRPGWLARYNRTMPFPPGAVDVWALLLLPAAAVAFLAFRRSAGVGVALLAVAGGLAGFAITGDSAVALALALVAVLYAHKHPRRAVPARPFLREGLLAVAVVAFYQVARVLIEGDAPLAAAHARAVVSFEKDVGLFVEPSVQHLSERSGVFMRVLGVAYTFGFLAVAAATLTWLFLTDNANYRLYRNALGISVALALVIIALYPVAPPRLLSESGLSGSLVTSSQTRPFANDYAAIPSLHVGWAVLTGFVFGRILGGWKGALIAPLPGVIMLWTVMAMGHHYWLDGAVGTAITMVPATLLLEGQRSRGHVPAGAQT